MTDIRREMRQLRWNELQSAREEEASVLRREKDYL